MALKRYHSYVAPLLTSTCRRQHSTGIQLPDLPSFHNEFLSSLACTHCSGKYPRELLFLKPTTVDHRMGRPLLTYTLCWVQLPYETGDFLSNGMSFCLAVGSPTLVTYSLGITILNRNWVREAYKDLRSQANLMSSRLNFDAYELQVRVSEILLQEAQQVPLRASQKDGWFSSLIVIPDNSEWWKQLESRLESTRRGVTASLVAQMAVAGISYLFTVISSFEAQLGDPTTALLIASGSLWIWLVGSSVTIPKFSDADASLDSRYCRVDHIWNSKQTSLSPGCSSSSQGGASFGATYWPRS